MRTQQAVGEVPLPRICCCVPMCRVRGVMLMEVARVCVPIFPILSFRAHDTPCSLGPHVRRGRPAACSCRDAAGCGGEVRQQADRGSEREESLAASGSLSEALSHSGRQEADADLTRVQEEEEKLQCLQREQQISRTTQPAVA